MKEQKKSSWGAAMVSFFKEYLFNFSGPGHLYYDENLTNEGKRKKNYIWRVLLLVTAVGVALLPFIAWNIFTSDGYQEGIVFYRDKEWAEGFQLETGLELVEFN